MEENQSENVFLLCVSVPNRYKAAKQSWKYTNSECVLLNYVMYINVWFI